MDSLELVQQHITGLLQLKGISREVNNTESLLTAGLMDSLDVMQTVLFLEENFGVDFSVRPFNADDFECIESIHQMVEESKRSE